MSAATLLDVADALVARVKQPDVEVFDGSSR
jgi:hypothetical protein